MGNLDIGGDGDAGSVTNPEIIHNHVAPLLGLSADEFISTLLTPHIKIGREIVKKTLGKNQVIDTVNGLLSSIYLQLVHWFTQKVNEKLGFHKDSTKTINLVKVPSFEVLRHNGHYQFFLNIINDRISFARDSTYYKYTQEYCIENKIEYTQVFNSNSILNDITHGTKKSIISFLNEAVITNGKEENFIDMVKSLHNPYYLEPTKKPGEFIVCHGGGKVTYTTGNWIADNKNKIDPEFDGLFLKGNPAIVHFVDRHQGLRLETVSNILLKELHELFDMLNNSVGQYVICINPNMVKDTSFNDEYVKNQLNAYEIFLSLRPYRIAHLKL